MGPCFVLHCSSRCGMSCWSKVEKLVEHEEILESQLAPTQTMTVLRWRRALHYVQAPGTNNSDYGVKRLQHMLVEKCAICFWQIGLPASKKHRFVQYMGSGMVLLLILALLFIYECPTPFS